MAWKKSPKRLFPLGTCGTASCANTSAQPRGSSRGLDQLADMPCPSARELSPKFREGRPARRSAGARLNRKFPPRKAAQRVSEKHFHAFEPAVFKGHQFGIAEPGGGMH